MPNIRRPYVEESRFCRKLIPTIVIDPIIDNSAEPTERLFSISDSLKLNGNFVGNPVGITVRENVGDEVIRSHSGRKNSQTRT